MPDESTEAIVLGNALRALRRSILTPNVAETSLDVRGFHKKNPAAQKLLETIGANFLAGYGDAAEAKSVPDAVRSIEEIPVRFRGFAYEGAAMAFMVRDRLPFGSGRLTADFLAGPGRPHLYMAYVGIGWAMARLPRFRWPKSEWTDPMLRWLVLDGYGFHQAYFHTRRYVHGHHQETAFPWPADDRTGYAANAIDQGIGRALWFVGGTDPAKVAALVTAFPEARRADLYSGVGLAATYAGGADERELGALCRLAGDYRPLLAQGSAFAAEARVRGGLLVPHTELATRVLCGMGAEDAAQLTQVNRPEHVVDGELPAYEVWRQAVVGEFVSLGGVSQ
jgi:enediyne biosynthesis protein E3